MSILEVLEYPDPILKKKSEPVAQVDDELRAFMDSMLETMYSANGVGLAAPQVGVLKRIIVIDPRLEEEDRGTPIFMINPEIVATSAECVLGFEGCLSVPEQRAEVERFEFIKVKFLDYDGNVKHLKTDDFLSIVIQHEIDHLDGKLYIDRISRLKRKMLLKKLEKYRTGEDTEE